MHNSNVNHTFYKSESSYTSGSVGRDRAWHSSSQNPEEVMIQLTWIGKMDANIIDSAFPPQMCQVLVTYVLFSVQNYSEHSGTSLPRTLLGTHEVSTIQRCCRGWVVLWHITLGFWEYGVWRCTYFRVSLLQRSHYRILIHVHSV